MGYDYFRDTDGTVYEITGLFHRNIGTFNNPKSFIQKNIFIAGDPQHTTIFNIENGIECMFNNVDFMPNVLGFVIDDKQYNENLVKLSDRKLHFVMHDYFITEDFESKQPTYRIYGYNGDFVLRIPPNKFDLDIQTHGDFMKIKRGPFEKELCIVYDANEIK